MKAIKSVLIILGLTVVVGCSDEPVFPHPAQRPLELPEVSGEGKNTFGCRIDGRVWLPITSERFSRLDAKLVSENCISISAHQESEDYGLISSFYINLTGFKNGGEMFLENDPAHTSRFYDWRLDKKYSVLKLSSNIVKLHRADPEERIISGTFSLMLLDSASHDTIRVTDGRFDIRYE